VQVADLERGDLGAAQPDLQADRQDRAIAQPAIVSSAGMSSSLRACALEKARSSLRRD
jgi:hypothetical protein